MVALLVTVPLVNRVRAGVEKFDGSRRWKVTDLLYLVSERVEAACGLSVLDPRSGWFSSLIGIC